MLRKISENCGIISWVCKERDPLLEFPRHTNKRQKSTLASERNRFSQHSEGFASKKIVVNARLKKLLSRLFWDVENFFERN
jgi:hypothetical protein